MDSFEKYKFDFENAIRLGIENNILGVTKPVPAHIGKLHKRKICKVMGVEIATDVVMAIDYYGYMKKSRGFNSQVKEVMENYKGSQVKLLDAKVVHFNSVRLEVLAKLAPELVTQFGDFKKAVLDAREFNHNYNV
jgi:hypothetical protein